MTDKQIEGAGQNDKLEKPKWTQKQKRWHSMATKAGLERARASGKTLGGHYNEKTFGENRDGHLGREARIAKANEYALKVASEILPLAEQGLSLRAMASALNEKGVPPPHGKGTWQHTSVANILKRLEALGKDNA